MNMEIFSSVALVVFTGLLVWATYKLAEHTKTLSDLTRSLVRIEEKRDQIENRQRRLGDLRKAIEVAETVQTIYSEAFVFHYVKPDITTDIQIQAIQTLQSFKQYIDDADIRLCLDGLCNEFDSVRREKNNYRPKNETISQNIKTIQNKVQSAINKWRDELSSVG